MQPQELAAQDRQVKEKYINGLLKKYEEDPQSLGEVERKLIGKFMESRNRANQLVNQSDQIRKQIDVLNQQQKDLDSQIQQELGKSAGIVDSVLTICPPDTPAPPAPNRKTRRAAAAVSRKNKGNGKRTPAPPKTPLPAEPPTKETQEAAN